MLYTSEGNLRAEDVTLRRIARLKVRAALDKLNTDTSQIVDALIARIETNGNCKMNADELLDIVNNHPRLQPERSTINRYTDAFPELKETTLEFHERTMLRARRKLQVAILPHEYARRFAHTKGLRHL